MGAAAGGASAPVPTSRDAPSLARGDCAAKTPLVPPASFSGAPSAARPDVAPCLVISPPSRALSKAPGWPPAPRSLALSALFALLLLGSESLCGSFAPCTHTRKLEIVGLALFCPKAAERCVGAFGAHFEVNLLHFLRPVRSDTEPIGGNKHSTALQRWQLLPCCLTD